MLGGAPPAIRVPASSANLGAGFDALAVALDRYLVVTRGDARDPRHPAAVAHRAAGGDGAVTVRAGFPAGRGLGFSGACRVGGALLALVEQGRAPQDARREAWRIAARLEGHGDNAAASAFGGVAVTAGDDVVKVPVALDLAVVCWVPRATTSTKDSRRGLPVQVAFADAVANVGRAALLVAALAAGEPGALRTATEDRLHQERRLAAAPEARAALEAMIEAGTLGAWLSGSGPAVAGFAERDAAAVVATRLPTTGEVWVASIDFAGATIEA